MPKWGRNNYSNRRANAPAKSPNFKIKLIGKAGFEQLSASLQTAFFELEKRGVHGVQNLAVYCAPLDKSGKPMLVRDDDGSVLETFELEIPGTEPVSAPSSVKRLVSPAVSGTGDNVVTAQKSVSAFNSRA